MAGRVGEPPEPRPGCHCQFAEDAVGKLDGVVTGRGGFVGVGKRGGKAGPSAAAVGGRRTGHASQDRRKSKVPAVIAAGPAQVIETEPEDVRVRIEIAARLLVHRVRAPLHHAKRDHGARKGVSAVVGAIHRLHIGGEGLQHAGTERQAQPQEQPRGEGQDLEFFSTGWMEIMAMCSHKHDSKINAPLRMGLRLPESAEFVKSLMRHFG